MSRSVPPEKAAAKLASQHKLYVRERIALLFDEDTFVEDGQLANSLADRLPADGVGWYSGFVAAAIGFSGLEAVDEVTMVAVPDLMAAYEQGAIDLETGIGGLTLKKKGPGEKKVRFCVPLVNLQGIAQPAGGFLRSTMIERHDTDAVASIVRDHLDLSRRRMTEYAVPAGVDVPLTL